MNMKIAQFKKAAKRYSADAKISLSESQEKLSGYFGYANFHALTSDLDPPTPKVSSIPSTDASKPFWNGLTHSEFKLLCYCLKEKFLNGVKSEEARNWGIKGISAFDACISAMPYAGVIELRSVTALEDCLRLESFEKMFLSIYDSQGKKFHGQQSWPRATVLLFNYLSHGLPGFQMQLVEASTTNSCSAFSRRPNSSLDKEQHHYRMAQVEYIYLDVLRSIEANAGPSKVRVEKFLGDVMSDCGLDVWLRQIAFAKRLPTKEELAHFGRANFRNEEYAIYG